MRHIIIVFLIFSITINYAQTLVGDDQYSNKIHPSYNLYQIHKNNVGFKVGGIDFAPDGRMFVCTWDSLGAIYEFTNVSTGDTNQIKVTKVASGLCEPLGIKWLNNSLYLFQRPELTKLTDSNNDGFMDTYQTIAASFGFNGNYHEFCFGLLYREGWFYGSLSTQRRVKYPHKPDRGSILRMDTLGNIEYLANGFRTPNGLCFGPDSLLYVTDNEGEWLPSSKLNVVKKGAFYGFRNVDLDKTLDLVPEPPVVWMPQNEIANSPSQPLIMQDGPYKNQLIVGDVTYGGIKRIFIEKVDTVHQGCIFPFTQGLEGGINRMAWGPDGGLYVGAVGSVGNWGQAAPKKRHGLEKLKYNNKSTFEMLAIRVTKEGFEIEFTEPLATNIIPKATDFLMKHWRYVPNERYGGPKIDEENLLCQSTIINEKRTKINLKINGLKQGTVVYFEIPKYLKSKSGSSLWSQKAWYTLNKLPKGYKLLKTAKTTPVKPIKENKPIDISKGKSIINKNGCMTCHSIEQKIIGPSFKNVASKYPNNAKSINYLIKKIKNGGKGVWGEEEMSAQSQLTAQELEVVVKYILSLK
ncbi:MAG: c-type cytochrome [Bacteroidota bacterium]|nr:c-type cytochrome [Bacteroidota bacterium]